MRSLVAQLSPASFEHVNGRRSLAGRTSNHHAAAGFQLSGTSVRVAMEHQAEWPKSWTPSRGDQEGPHLEYMRHALPVFAQTILGSGGREEKFRQDCRAIETFRYFWEHTDMQGMSGYAVAIPSSTNRRSSARILVSARYGRGYRCRSRMSSQRL